MAPPIVRVRLSCESFYVDVRVLEMRGRFIASADTPAGPTLGLGAGPVEAITAALEPFDDAVDELLQSLTDRLE
jgi:hypothetical protein